MQNSVLQLDSRDNVLVALTPLRKGELIPFSGDTYSLLSDIPAKQKFVTRDLQPGDQVIMYGGLVGTATAPIRRGDLLSTRNIRHAASDFHASEEAARWTPPDVSAWRERTFLGYHRADGQVGTRNYWLVIPLVFCENRNLGVLKQAFEEELGFALPQIYRRQVAELVRLYREGKAEELKNLQFVQDKGASTAPKVFRNIDGIKFLAHEQGCGGTREDTRNLCGLLAGYIHHPNVAGATILSLAASTLRYRPCWKRSSDAIAISPSRYWFLSSSKSARNPRCSRKPYARRSRDLSKPTKRREPLHRFHVFALD